MTKNIEPIISMPIKIKPYQHQIEGFNRCMQSEGYGLLFDVGLGKSLTAVAVAGARHKKKQVERVLVISPLAVVPVWEQEFNHLNFEAQVVALEGSALKKRDTLRNLKYQGLQVVIINYDSARVMVEELTKYEPDWTNVKQVDSICESII